MNKLNVAIFKLIVNAASTFKGRVNDTLRKYRKEMTEARKYAEKFKDEESILNSQKSILIAKAQEEIRKAQRMFASDLERYTEQLSEQLQNHVSEPLDAGFRDQLHTIAQFGLKPSKTQIEALLKQNSGNAIGISALSKVLSDVGSPYRVEFRAVEEYEKDLAKIRSLMVDPIAYDIEENELHPEAVEVMSGLEQVFSRDDGTTYRRGTFWTGQALLVACGTFDTTVEAIEHMQDSWISDVSFASAESINEADTLKKELLSSLEDEPEQAEEHESSTTIVDSDNQAIEFAQKYGKDAGRQPTIPAEYVR